MRHLIDICEGISRRDPRIQFHLSVEPNLIPMESFAQQSRTISHAGARGEAGGDGIYTTHALAYWITQLAYEQIDDFPRYCYLVLVRDGGNSTSIDAAHQEVSQPQDVIVLDLLMDIGKSDDMPDIGWIEWLADRWVNDHRDQLAALEREQGVPNGLYP